MQSTLKFSVDVFMQKKKNKSVEEAIEEKI